MMRNRSPTAHEEPRPANNRVTLEVDSSALGRPSIEVAASVNILSQALLETLSPKHPAKLPLGP